ncbi:Hypothetical_protein [Hexamita inflata]|uniref:Hypothetical_protein n=1 Tax=Hexamita inflata TaxID=28002 RepID=A0AA86R965_9EUKA|nr:Hypothetical protein HINF_LOCUS61774 [Hexamita inflata]
MGCLCDKADSYTFLGDSYEQQVSKADLYKNNQYILFEEQNNMEIQIIESFDGTQSSISGVNSSNLENLTSFESILLKLKPQKNLERQSSDAQLFSTFNPSAIIKTNLTDQSGSTGLFTTHYELEVVQE